MTNKTLIEPGRLYKKSSAEGTVIKLLELAKFIRDADLSNPGHQSKAKRAADELIKASIGTILSTIN